MRLKDAEAWKRYEETNLDDEYGRCCVDVARRVMETLDNEKSFSPSSIISQANKDLAAGISGFMAGAVAEMVSRCHERGDEFRRLWNKENQIDTEGDRATENGGVLNPALLSISQIE
jgi:hypothetical protein